MSVDVRFAVFLCVSRSLVIHILRTIFFSLYPFIVVLDSLLLFVEVEVHNVDEAIVDDDKLFQFIYACPYYLTLIQQQI